ncbi:MAG: glycosyltransferase [Bauldia sp.]
MTLFSVLLPLRNADRFLKEAIDSVLAQTIPDFELIVVLDHSTDGSEAIARSVQRQDLRVRLLQNPGVGLVDALNAGAEIATGEFIARLDADDRMRPNRLKSQRDRFAGRPEIVAIGSSAVVIDEASRPVGRIKVVTGDAAIRFRLMRSNPFVHSSMTMRRSAFVTAGRYRHDFPHAEDYDLWLRLAQRGRLANIAEPLVDHRRHSDSVSARFSDAQRLNRQLCILEWKRTTGVVEAPAADRIRDDIVRLFGRAADLAGNAERLEEGDLDLFARALPHLSGDESRRLSRLVRQARHAGKVGPAAAAAFQVQATVTSRIAFARNCRTAVRALRTVP